MLTVSSRSVDETAPCQLVERALGVSALRSVRQALSESTARNGKDHLRADRLKTLTEFWLGAGDVE
jgi:hypothetical protein